MTILRLVRSVSATIPESGGQLASPLDDTNYSFPAGLFSETVVVRHSLLLEEDAPRTGQLASVNHFFDVSATFLSSGQPAQPEPGRTYTVTIEYDSEDIGPIKEKNLALYRWNEAESRWSPNGITSVVDTDSHSLSAEMSQFSIYGLLGDSERIFLPSLSRK